MSLPKCTYLNCPDKPVREIRPPYGRSWWGCEAHWPAMAESMRGGQPQSFDLKIIDLTSGSVHRDVDPDQRWAWPA